MALLLTVADLARACSRYGTQGDRVENLTLAAGCGHMPADDSVGSITVMSRGGPRLVVCGWFKKGYWRLDLRKYRGGRISRRNDLGWLTCGGPSCQHSQRVRYGPAKLRLVLVHRYNKAIGKAKCPFLCINDMPQKYPALMSPLPWENSHW